MESKRLASRRNALKMFAAVGISGIGVGVAQASDELQVEESARYEGPGGGYPVQSTVLTQKNAVTDGAVEYDTTVSASVSYYGSFEDNSTRTDGTPYFLDFTLVGEGSSRIYSNGSWDLNNEIDYQAYTINNTNDTGIVAYDSGPHFGLYPNPGTADQLDSIPEGAEVTLDFAASYYSDLYALGSYVDDMVSTLVDTTDDPADGTRFQFDVGGDFQDGFAANTMNHNRILIPEDTRDGEVVFTEEINSTSAAVNPVTASITATVSDDTVSFTENKKFELIKNMKKYAEENVEVTTNEDGYPSFKIPRENFDEGSVLRELADDNGIVWKIVTPPSFSI